MEPSTYKSLNPKKLNPKIYGVESIKDLEAEPVILTPDLDRLVKTITSEIPPVLADDKAGSRDLVRKWGTSVDWASSAWKTIYIALVARRKPKFIREHPISLHPAKEFIIDLAKLHVTCPEKAIQWLKFQTCYLFAKATNQEELPPDPLRLGKPGILAGGWVYQLCRKVMRDGQAKFGTALDILLSKYGMPKAPASFVDNTLLSHQKALTKEDVQTKKVDCAAKGDYDGLHAVLEEKVLRRRIEEKIVDIVQSVFRKPFRDSHVFPKPSACFERNTQNGGQMRELFEEFLKSDWLSGYLEKEGLHSDDELVSMACSGPDTVLEFRTSKIREYALGRFEEFVEKGCVERLADSLDAKQFGILEPLKCRVIMMARAKEMLRVTSIQKFMHKSLKRVPAFKYIGTPDTEEDIRETFGTELLDGECYVSGDYSAATDNLRSSFSEFAWNCVASRVGIVGELYQLGKKCLTGHKIFNPKGEEIGLQKNGQSMGSPMSFPILCIVNAACWLAAYEKPVTFLYKGPLRVNGDDIVFKGAESRYDFWWDVNRVAGLFPSKGKNYRSKDFLIINSHAYRRSEASGWRYVKAVNVALAQDLVRKGIYAGGRTGAPFFMQKANFDHLTKGHQPSIGNFLRNCFLEHVKVPKGVSPHLGVLAGGPGFLLENEEPSLLSKAQTALYFCSKNRFFEQIPRPENDSYEGSLVKGLIMDSTRKTRVRADVEDPLLETGWRKERDSVVNAGDLLGYMLAQYDLEDDRTSPGQTFRDPILFPQREVLEGQGIFFEKKYRSRVRRYEERLSAFYGGKRFNKAFPPVTGGRRYCTLQPSEVETCRKLCRNWKIHTEVFGLHSVGPAVAAFTYH